MKLNRRDLLQTGALSAAAVFLASNHEQSFATESVSGSVVIDPTPQFDLSPYLFMQFMEPLGITDSSVEACWSYDAEDWRQDFVDRTKDLAPPMMRFGGLFSRYYKWREGVGPADKRPLMRNYYWGGKETNRVGTGEFINFCRKVNSEPLMCVNFASDGRKYFGKMKEGNRTADAAEAAEWVSFCNDPANKERGAEPYNLKYWQLGNETSYGPGGFSKDQSIEQTIAFAKAMRQRDPSIKLLGWGDGTGARDARLWATDLTNRAGELIDYVAFHMMQQSPIRKDTLLNSLRYQSAPETAWGELMEMVPRVEAKLKNIEQSCKHPLAITEGHLSLAPRNVNPLMTEWLVGVYTARVMNIYHRHGDRVKIATAADYCGSRWTTNALMLQVPNGISYLLPAGAVMRLFRKHGGTQSLGVDSKADGLDITASREGDRVFLHVANTEFSKSVEANLSIAGETIKGARAFEITPEDPRQAINESQPNVFDPIERPLAPLPNGTCAARFPARSVTAVELTVG